MSPCMNERRPRSAPGAVAEGGFNARFSRFRASLRPIWLPLCMALGAPMVAWLAHQGLGRHLAPLSLAGWAWSLLGAPLLEEAIFRWGLQESLAQWLRGFLGRWRVLAAGLANGLASLAFVLSHQPADSLLRRMDLFLPALALGLLWTQRRQYWACVGMHAWFNFCLAATTGLA